MIVFDVDGVLVDSKQLVMDCYRRAGVRMPDEAWGLPWHTWLDDARAHDKKNRYYLEAIDKGALPLLDGTGLVLELIAADVPLGFATGSSLEAFVSVLKASGIQRAIETRSSNVKWQVGCARDDKVQTLLSWHTKGYVDDRLVGRSIAIEVGCEFVLYTPGHIDDIRTEIRQWT